MTVAYFDCFAAGISGDMTLGALLDAGADRALLDATVDALGLGAEVTLEVSHEARGHAAGSRVKVSVVREHSRTVPALRAMLEASTAPELARRRAVDALNLIARAESRIHGVAEAELHLHELGGADTLVDLLGAFWLLNGLGVAKVCCSTLPAPRGRLGSMSLPAPASLRILEGTGAVIRPVEAERELVTPTGAAIVAACAEFRAPALRLKAVGYGIGAADEPGNALAVWIGEEPGPEDEVEVIETNLDDMAPHLLAALAEDLMTAGALDVSIVPALMKKGRPGHMLRVLADRPSGARLAEQMLRSSTTLGVRITPARRVLADRRLIEVDTELGRARAKIKLLDGRAIDVMPEYEDCRRLARESGRDLRDVMHVVRDAARRQAGIT